MLDSRIMIELLASWWISHYSDWAIRKPSH